MSKIKMNKRNLILLALLSLPLISFAAGNGNIKLDKAHIDLHDKASLQRGAKLYVNYCSGCHSMKYMRYNRLANDTGIVTKTGEPDVTVLKKSIILNDARIVDTMEVAMKDKDSQKWFGAVIPDLTLVARSKGVDWLYTYLRGFYQDKTKQFGTNNIVFPDVSMPNVFINIQGLQVPEFKTEKVEIAGKPREIKSITHLKLVKQGSMSPQEFDSAMTDLVNFLAYAAEPMKLDRIRLGYWVIGFLLILLVFAIFLKKEYWRDVKQNDSE